MDYSLLLGVHSFDKDNDKFEESKHSRFTHMLNKDKNEQYFLGVIDILQEWNLKKKAELQVKSINNEKSKLSVAHPKDYGSRFVNFIIDNLTKTIDDEKNIVN
jgi:hypothetical protein